MTTPLFPQDYEPITIQQGQGGSCFLLASLDCIFNLGLDGRNLVKSLFTERADGSVIVRLKRSTQSNFLQLANLGDKYTYYHSETTDEDIFVISKERLEEIDHQPEGVQSNSLAVKILERLSAYYYVGTWNPDDELASLMAHSAASKRVIDGETSTCFVSKLLKIEAHDYASSAIEGMIQLKTINPSQPIYISIAYGQKDKHGAYHGRHSLRIKEIRINQSGEYEFILVNPWDNRKTEIFSMQEIQKRKCRFCLFATDSHRYRLTKKLLACSIDQGMYVFQNPRLLNILTQMQATDSTIDRQFLTYCIDLYKQVPEFETMYQQFQANQINAFIRLINHSQGSKTRFLTSLNKSNQKTVTNYSSRQDNNADTLVRYIKLIKDFPIVFNNANTLELLANEEERLKRDVLKLGTTAFQFAKTNYAINIYQPLSDVLQAKLKQIKQKANDIKTKAEQENQHVISESKFLKNLDRIKLQAIDFLNKALADPATYKTAANSGAELFHSLVKARGIFLNSLEPFNLRCNNFRQACQQAVEKAEPELLRHREWKQVITDLANLHVCISTLGIANLYTGRFGIFHTPSNSETALMEFKESFNRISPANSG